MVRYFLIKHIVVEDLKDILRNKIEEKEAFLNARCDSHQQLIEQGSDAVKKRTLEAVLKSLEERDARPIQDL